MMGNEFFLRRQQPTGPAFLHHPWQTMILSGRQRRSPSRPVELTPGHCHLLLHLGEGSWRLCDHDAPDHGPAVLLLPPSDQPGIVVPRETPVTQLAVGFGTDLRWPRLCSRTGFTMACWPEGETPLSERWGLPVPVRWPESLADEVATVIDDCAQRWWRGSRQHVISNHQLATCFHRLLEHLLMADDAAYPEPQLIDDLASRIEALASRHLERGITASELATMMGYSRSALDAACRRLDQPTPARLITRIRLDRACTMLSAGRPTGAIAQACGFTDRSSFTRFFTRETGTSPTAWRRQQRPR